MPKPTQLMIIVIGISLLVLSTGLGSGQNVGPTLDDRITKENLIKALKILKPQDPQGAVIKTIRRLGVDFETTKVLESELRKAGATLELIKAVKESYRQPPVRPPSPTPSIPSGSEDALWEKAKSSKNPEVSRRYLRQYPNGKYVKEAQARLRDLAGTVVRNQLGMELVWIPPGKFIMGSEKFYVYPTKPHPVTIPEGFYMGRYEVTIKEWRAVMGDLPAWLKDMTQRIRYDRKFVESDQQPILVKWQDTQEFIRKLNERNDGFTYRLPTEAEWEYAARAGTTTKFAFGDTLSSMQANFDGKAATERLPGGIAREKPLPVGSFKPNGWGLYDTHGNVAEWCEDVWHKTYDGAPADGSAWLTGADVEIRVLRGGHYSYQASWCSSTWRSFRPRDMVVFENGLRLVALARPEGELSQPRPTVTPTATALPKSSPS